MEETSERRLHKKRSSLGRMPQPQVAENIKVVVRCRPLSMKEIDAGYKECVALNLAEANVTVNHLCGAPDRWTFDAVVNNTYTQRDIFTQYIQPLVDSVFDGFNATVFAYGQSGSGKTYTMSGDLEDQEVMGIIPRAFQYIFSRIKEMSQTHPNRHFAIACSMVELYLGKVRDLLAKQQVSLAVKENKDKTFYVAGVMVPEVKFPEDLTRWMEEGTERRKVGSTDLNADSSRSHSIFTLILECIETSDDGDTRSVTSKLNLVDLAGSERQSKTAATGDTLKEGCNINLSLSALGTVIDTIVKGRGHIPFRSSPLTMLLKDSLGGSSKTCMFANIGPSEHNLSETVSTLRFADRAKEIKNKPIVNMDAKDQKIVELTELVHDLRLKLQQFESAGLKEMEAELEDLRTRCGALQVDFDNAVHGREADIVDFENARMKLESQLSKTALERDDVADQLARRTEEVKLAEALAQDEKNQRAEIMDVIGGHFKCTVKSNDDVIRVLLSKEQGSGISADDHSRLQAQCNEIATELRILKESRASQVSQLAHTIDHLTDQLAQSNRKVEKLKHSVEEEKKARKQLIKEQSSSDVSPMRSASFFMQSFNATTMADSNRSADLSDGLKAKIVELQTAESAQNERVKALEGQLERLSKDKATTLVNLLDQIHRMDELVGTTTAVGGAPSALPAGQLKVLISTKTRALKCYRDEIKSLEELVSAFISGSSISGPRRGSLIAASLKTKQDEFAKAQRDALREEIDELAEHRGVLLDVLFEGEPADFSAELKKLQSENDSLRKRIRLYEEAQEKSNSEMISELCGVQRVEELEALIKELQGGSETTASAAATTTSSEISELHQKMEKMSHDFLAKEERWIETIEVMSKVRKDSDEGDDGENPLHSVVELLHSDKQELEAEVTVLSKELRALQSDVEDGNARVKSIMAVNALKETEIARLQEVLTRPRATDSELVASLRAELSEAHRQRKKMSAPPQHPLGGVEKHGGSSSPIAKAQNGQSVVSEVNRLAAEEGYRKVESELKTQISLKDLECANLRAEFETARADLEDELRQHRALEEENAKSQTILSALRADLSASQRENTQLSNKVTELKYEIDCVHHNEEDRQKATEQLEQRIQERTRQLQDLRETLAKQKAMLDKLKSRLESQQQAVAASKQELADKERQHQVALREQEQNIHILMNKKIESLAEEHHRALNKKDEQAHTLRKKIQKLEQKLEKVIAQYDRKICEYADLQNALEEQKIDMLRMMKEETVAQMDEAHEQIRDTLQAAKEQQRLRRNKFDNGEVTSALAEIRAAGTGAALVARAHRPRPHSKPSRTPTESPTLDTYDTWD